MDCVGLSLALLVLTIVGFVILVGRSVVMVSLLGHERVSSVHLFLDELLSSLSATLLVLGVLCLTVLFLCGIVLLVLLIAFLLGGYRFLVRFVA